MGDDTMVPSSMYPGGSEDDFNALRKELEEAKAELLKYKPKPLEVFITGTSYDDFRDHECAVCLEKIVSDEKFVVISQLRVHLSCVNLGEQQIVKTVLNS